MDAMAADRHERDQSVAKERLGGASGRLEFKGGRGGYGGRGGGGGGGRSRPQAMLLDDEDVRVARMEVGVGGVGWVGWGGVGWWWEWVRRYGSVGVKEWVRSGVGADVFVKVAWVWFGGAGMVAASSPPSSL